VRHATTARHDTTRREANALWVLLYLLPTGRLRQYVGDQENNESRDDQVRVDTPRGGKERERKKRETRERARERVGRGGGEEKDKGRREAHGEEASRAEA